MHHPSHRLLTEVTASVLPRPRSARCRDEARPRSADNDARTRVERVTRITQRGCDARRCQKGVVTKRITEATGRILIVHWHPVVLRGLAAWIRQVPQMQLVGLADSCEDALDLAAELQPDLVLIGYSTPDMGGIEATRRLIAMRSDTRILLIGASYNDFERRAQVRESGARGYVLLDTPPWELAATLRGLVRE